MIWNLPADRRSTPGRQPTSGPQCLTALKVGVDVGKAPLKTNLSLPI